MFQRRFYKHITSISYSLFLIVVWTGCKKVETTRTTTVSNATSQVAIASDEVTLNDEFDQAIDDAMTVLSNHSATVAGALVDTSQINLGIIEIDYYGKEADGTKSRTGADSIHETLVNGHVVPWGNAGATATVTFGTVNTPGYEVLFLSTNTSVRLGGTATLTNIYGGYLKNVTASDSLVEKIRGAVTYTFNDNVATIKYNPFNITQMRTFTKSDTTIDVTTRADTSINGFQNVCNWGLDRFGDAYYTTLNTATIQNISNPGLSYNPLSGTKNIENISEPIACTFGVNQQGVVTGNGMPYGFIITWINGGGQYQNVISYYY